MPNFNSLTLNELLYYIEKHPGSAGALMAAKEIHDHYEEILKTRITRGTGRSAMPKGGTDVTS